MSDYTPTTEEIREYVETGGEPRPWVELNEAEKARQKARRVNARLYAEDQRLRRLLPPAPSGHHWSGQISSTDDWFDLAASAASVTYRIRYRLVPDDGSDDG